jgi:hypothetical protein
MDRLVRAHGPPDRRARPWDRARRAGVPSLALLAAVGLALALAACAGAPAPAGVPGTGSAYLVAHVDYPYQMRVGETATVTLTLEAHAGAPADAALPLPSDLGDFADIAVAADAMGDGQSALAWQLLGPYRQSLLAPRTDAAAPAGYEGVTFRWRVLALAPGHGTQRLALTFFYDPRAGGAEQRATVALSAAPEAIESVMPSAVDLYLVPLRVPLAALLCLAALLALARFLWGTAVVVAHRASPYRDVRDVLRDRRRSATAIYRANLGARDDGPRDPWPPYPAAGRWAEEDWGGDRSPPDAGGGA